MQSLVEQSIERVDVEVIRTQKRALLLETCIDHSLSMFSDDQKSYILEFKWLEDARARFLSHKNVYLWRGISHDSAAQMADEQGCAVVFFEDNVTKVILPRDVSGHRCYVLDEILLAQPINAFQNQASTMQTVATLFPEGFAHKAYYYQAYIDDCSVSDVGVFSSKP